MVKLRKTDGYKSTKLIVSIPKNSAKTSLFEDFHPSLTLCCKVLD